MATPFEAFVNSEIPKRVSTEQNPATLTAGKIPVSTGTGLGVQFLDPSGIDALKGPKGDKGDTGAAGPAGPQGPQGDSVVLNQPDGATKVGYNDTTVADELLRQQLQLLQSTTGLAATDAQMAQAILELGNEDPVVAQIQTDIEGLQADVATQDANLTDQKMQTIASLLGVATAQVQLAETIILAGEPDPVIARIKSDITTNKTTQDQFNTALASQDATTPGAVKVGYRGLSLASHLDKAAIQVNYLKTWDVTNSIHIFGIDSKTFQMSGAGSGMDRLSTVYRCPSGLWSSVVATANFGSSGYPLSLYANGAAASTLPSLVNTNTGNNSLVWDYYGHTPGTAVTLKTAIAWRNQFPNPTFFHISGGTNDCILNASVGNMTQAAITDYLSALLLSCITQINANNPADRIVLRVPSPMTARPYVSAAGYPSQAQYPAFGSVLADDQALVEKWNQAIRNAYLRFVNVYPNVLVQDTWEVYGTSDTTLTVSQLPYMGDLVHPGIPGYRAEMDQMVNLLAGRLVVAHPRVNEAELRAAILGTNPWYVWPAYFRYKQGYRKVASGILSAIGANYIYLGNLPYASFVSIVGRGAISIVLGDAGASQQFTTYTAVDNGVGTGTNLTAITPTAAMIALGATRIPYEVYIADGVDLIAGDAYVDNLAKKAHAYVTGTTSSGGTNYLDFVLSSNGPRLSSKYGAGLSRGTLVIGGTVQQQIALNNIGGAMNGTPTQRTWRFYLTGDQSALANQPAAIIFDDTLADPRIWEIGALSQYAAVTHAQNASALIVANIARSQPVTMSATIFEILSGAVTVDVYSITQGARTLLGTITITAGTYTASLASGNPTTVPAGQIYQFVVTSNTTSTTTQAIRFSMNPT